MTHDGPKQRIVKQVVSSTLGGMDSGIAPSLIRDNQVAFAVNVIMRGGFPHTRPGFPERTLVFEDAEKQAWYENHLFQGGFTYRAKNVPNFQVVSVGGRIFKIEPLAGFRTTEITPIGNTQTTLNFTVPVVGSTVAVTVDSAQYVSIGYPAMIAGKTYIITAKTGNVLTAKNVNDTPAALVAQPATVTYLDVNDPTIPRTYFEQARQWLVIQNGRDAAILFDGGGVHRSITTGSKPEVPTGKQMTYAGRRLWVNTTGNQIAAGDIAGGATDVINFTEELLGLIVPARFQIDEEVTALVKAVNIDTSLGQGPVLVFTRTGAYSINVPFNRAKWADLTYPIETVTLAHSGSESQYSTIQVNSDLHYRAPDGWRSLILARREDAQWGNVPISSELSRILDDDEESLLQYSSAILFQNRVIFTANPKLTSNGIAHDGLCVFDLDPISNLGNKAAPAYDGLWRGVRPTLLVKGDFDRRSRGFMFTLDENDKNKLHEIDAAEDDDDGTPIECHVEYASFKYQPQSNEFDLKKISATELWPTQVRGTVTFTLQWRPDEMGGNAAPCWFTWGQREICSTVEDCEQDVDGCKTIKNYRPGYRTRMGFGTPSDDVCEPQNRRPGRLGFQHQLRLIWFGQCGVRKIMSKCELVEEDVFAPCGEDE
jgi:hypothetical protein